MSDVSFDVVFYILSIGVPAIMALATFVLLLFGGQLALERFWKMFGALRPAIDEPTDPAYALLEPLFEKLTGTDVDRAELIKAILQAYDAAMAGKPDA